MTFREDFGHQPRQAENQNDNANQNRIPARSTSRHTFAFIGFMFPLHLCLDEGRYEAPNLKVWAPRVQVKRAGAGNHLLSGCWETHISVILR